MIVGSYSCPKNVLDKSAEDITLEAHFGTKESFQHFQAHYRTIHTLLLAFPGQHQLVFCTYTHTRPK
jgi:hypothetical protein